MACLQGARRAQHSTYQGCQQHSPRPLQVAAARCSDRRCSPDQPGSSHLLQACICIHNTAISRYNGNCVRTCCHRLQPQHMHMMAIQLQREHGSIGTAVPDREADAQEAQLRRAARQHARCWRGGRAGRRAGKRCTVVRKALCKLIGGCESTLPVRLHLARGVLVAGVLRADLAGAVGVHGCAQLRRAARHPACLLKPLKPDSCMHVCHCSHRIHCFTKRSGASTKIG